jgi:hypothetical protein
MLPDVQVPPAKGPNRARQWFPIVFLMDAHSLPTIFLVVQF